MASSLMHLAIAKELIKQWSFKDIDRFKFGAVLPDDEEKKETHLKRVLSH